MHGRVDNIFTDITYEKFSNSLNDVLVRYEVRLDSEGDLFFIVMLVQIFEM